MSGSDIAARVDAILDEHGETAVLSRAGEVTTITLKVKRAGSTDEEGANTSSQAAIKIMMGTRDIAASPWTDKLPKKNDQLLVGGRARRVVDHPDTRVDGDVTVAHFLLVVG